MNEANPGCGGLPESASGAMKDWDREKSTVEILVVEDDPEIGRFFQMKLAQSSRAIFVAQTISLAAQVLEERNIALILLDLTLPDADGRSFLKRVRDNARTSTVPIIVVSGRRGPVTKAECFELGADEYFEKPVPMEVLAAAVGAKLKRIAQLDLRERHDALTGVLNRLAFQEVFQRLQALSRRAHASLALAILDMDQFKAINDRFGHPQGDRVLYRAAQIIELALRRSDVVGRWGGDEFVVLLPDTDKDGAQRALDNVRRALQEESIQVAGQALRLSFSAGVVNVREDVSLDDAVAEADRFLYQAKAQRGTKADGQQTTIESEPMSGADHPSLVLDSPTALADEARPENAKPLFEKG
jgi:diguanylate cyclase (GGDEF)-like protein